MVLNLMITCVLTSIVYLILIWQLPYDKAYYVGIALLLLLGIIFFGFNKKIANRIYSIENNSNVSIEHQYQNEEKTLPFRRAIGFTTLWSVVITFGLSVANVVSLGKKYEISNGISITIGLLNPINTNSLFVFR